MMTVTYGGMLAPTRAGAALTPAKVERYRTELSALPQVEPITENYFIPQDDGTFLYCRKVTRRKDIATLGKIHRMGHFYVVAKGSIAIRGETETTIHHAGDVIVSAPGTRRLVISLEDSVSITMHRVSSMDLEALEKELVEDDEWSNYGPGNKLKQERLQGEI